MSVTWGYICFEREEALNSYYGGKFQWKKGTREVYKIGSKDEVGQSSTKTRTRQLKRNDVKLDGQEMTVNIKVYDSYKSWEVKTKDYGKERKWCSSHSATSGRGDGQSSRGICKDAFSCLVVLEGCWFLWTWGLCRTDLEPWSICVDIGAHQRKDYFPIFRKGTSVSI